MGVKLVLLHIIGRTLTEDVSEHSAENIWIYEGESKNIHNEELHTLYPRPNITRIVISRTKWQGYVAGMR
jgi:hypothetical protein